jgi:hypothetical protein
MRRLLSTVWAAALLVLSTTPLLAQAETLREQGLGRAYWHVFIAYAIAVLLILGWVISIARRLRRVEDRLRSSGD